MKMSKKLHVLMPKGLKIDQVIALALLLEVLKLKIEEVAFYFLGLDDDATIPADAIDLDARLHYQRGHGLGSATEVVAKAHNVTNLGNLIEELGRNNTTGFMRMGDKSFAKLAQKLYQLRASKTSMHDHCVEMLTHFVPIGAAYIRTARDGRLGAKEIFQFPQYGITKEGGSRRIHHLSGYISRLMEEIKPETEVADTDKVLAELKWWHEKFIAAQRAETRAVDRVEEINLDEEEKKGNVKKVGGYVIVFLWALADEVAKAMFMKHRDIAVLIVSRPDGIAIMPNFEVKGGPVMRELYDMLADIEPNSWHFAERGDNGLILSGSARRTAEVPTLIGQSRDDLFALMENVWG